MSTAERRRDEPHIVFVQLIIDGSPDGGRRPCRLGDVVVLMVQRPGRAAVQAFDQPIGGDVLAEVDVPIYLPRGTEIRFQIEAY